LGERLLRWLIAQVLTRPGIARAMLRLAKFTAPLSFLLPGRLRAMVRKGASVRPSPRVPVAATHAPDAKRIALMPGCVQKAVAPQIDEAVARLLARRGFSLAPVEGAGCCGSLSYHLGRENEAKAWAKRAIEGFERMDNVEAILISATGCSSHLKDLPNLFAGDPAWQPRAERFAAMVKDFAELISPRGAERPHRLRVAYHAPCSLQHGLRIFGANETLLAAAGFEVLTIPEGHLCCGSAGSYSILQPELSNALRDRKLANIATTEPDVIATANIGCLEHLSGGAPIVHVAELLDWAEGGPRPVALHQIARA
jgi:glycolate oxidase iron-sulfur subunit